ncbi:MAG: molybdenum cofactor guanylyltransferase [Ignavibacteriaceae bacterium]|jgi:molybdopterin-guanine dinucleotide biosynthesis protein A|nr:molybdenum cofactor guanylyltransferase [Ignavibacteriaceae bacterium]
MYSDITGIILAGGKSSRMGINKCFLKIGEDSIIERILSIMKSVFDKVIIITNTPVEYTNLGVMVHKDILKGFGPIGGIHSGLTHSSTDENFVISCDVPLMIKEMIEFITEYKSDKLIRFCKACGYNQPLAGIYRKGLIPEIEKFLNQSGDASTKSFRQLIKNVDAEIINPEGLSFYKEELFFNVNNLKDYGYILQK